MPMINEIQSYPFNSEGLGQVSILSKGKKLACCIFDS